MHIIQPITAKQVRDYNPPRGNLTSQDLAALYNQQWAGIGVTQENGRNIFHPREAKGLDLSKPGNA